MRSEEEIREAMRHLGEVRKLADDKFDRDTAQFADRALDMLRWLLGEPAEFEKVIEGCREADEMRRRERIN